MHKARDDHLKLKTQDNFIRSSLSDTNSNVHFFSNFPGLKDSKPNQHHIPSVENTCIGCTFFSRGSSGGKEMTRCEAWEPPERLDAMLMAHDGASSALTWKSPLEFLCILSTSIDLHQFGNLENMFLGWKSPTPTVKNLNVLMQTTPPPGPLMAATSLAEAELLPWLSRSNLLRICPTKSG